MKLLYGIALNLVSVKIHGVLPTCRHYQPSSSDCRSRFAFQQFSTERKEEVSAARHHYGHRRCTPYNYDINGNAAFIRSRHNSVHFNERNRHNRNNCSGSRNYRNYSGSSWRLDSCLLALTGVTAVLCPKKENYACHINSVGDSVAPWNSSILELLHNSSAFIIRQKLGPNSFKSELFQALWLPLLSSARPLKACL